MRGQGNHRIQYYNNVTTIRGKINKCLSLQYEVNKIRKLEYQYKLMISHG